MPKLVRKRTRVVTNKKGKKVERVSWVVQFPTGKTKDGKTKYLYETFKTETEANDLVDDLKGERKDTGGVTKPSEQPLGEYLDYWLETTKRKRRENTNHSYSEMVRTYIKPRLGKMKVCALKLKTIERFYSKLEYQGCSSRTVRYVHSILHSAFEKAIKWGMLKKGQNPTEGASLPEANPTREIEFMNEDQARRFLQAARAKNENETPKHRLGVVFELALTTGIRPGEVFGLCWDKVDLDGSMIYVHRSLARAGSKWFLKNTPKTKAARRAVSIPPGMVESLREWKSRQAQEYIDAGELWEGKRPPREGFVFTTKRGNPLEIRNVSLRDLVAVQKTAGLAIKIPPKTSRRKSTYKAKFPMYALRHTHATMLFLKGVPARVISERLGHKKVSFTMDTYVHLLPEMESDATEKLTAALYG